MIGFLVALIAGYFTPQLDSPVSVPLRRSISAHVPVQEVELRLISFIVAMLAAGLIAALFDSGSAFWVILGGALGYFGKRLFAAGQREVERRRAD